METGAAEHLHDVVRFEHKARRSVDNEAVFQLKRERLGQLRGGLRGLGVNQTARDRNLGHRGGIGQSACLHHQVFNRHVGSPPVLSGREYLAIYLNIPVADQLCLCGNEEHILVDQRDIGHRASHDARHIDGNDLKRTVGPHTVKDTMGSESIFGETISLLDQATNGGHLFA